MLYKCGYQAAFSDFFAADFLHRSTFYHYRPACFPKIAEMHECGQHGRFSIYNLGTPG